MTDYSKQVFDPGYSVRMRMADFVLYQRDDCQLCDRALAVLAQARVLDFDSVWVEDSEELESRYGTRVPVLRDLRNGRELDWPFDPATVSRWISAPI